MFVTVLMVFWLIKAHCVGGHFVLGPRYIVLTSYIANTENYSNPRSFLSLESPDSSVSVTNGYRLGSCVILCHNSCSYLSVGQQNLVTIRTHILASISQKYSCQYRLFSLTEKYILGGTNKLSCTNSFSWCVFSFFLKCF